MNGVVTDYAVALLIAALSTVMAYATLYINKAKQRAVEETGKIKEERERELLRSALDQLELLVTTTVKAFEQTTAKDLRMAVRSGNTGRDALLNLVPKAAAKVYANMKPEYLKALEKNMADVNAYVTDLIESKVLDVKTETDEGLIMWPDDGIGDADDEEQ